MVPAYALAVIALGQAAWRWRKGGPRSVPRPWVVVASAVPVVLLSLLSAALPSVFPVFQFDTPTGPYGVGTADYELKGGPDAAHL